MGLDTTHDCWHGGYSAFSRWREKVAEVAGYLIRPVKWSENYERNSVLLEWHRYQEDKEIMGEWDETPHDPLIVLFAHSDCDGVIHPAQAGPLADALEALLPSLEGDGGGHVGNYRDTTQRFIDGLRNAVAANEDVGFH